MAILKSRKIPIKSVKSSEEGLANPLKEIFKKKEVTSDFEKETIEDIYRDEHRKKIDMTKIERKPVARKKLVIYLLLVLLGMLAMVSVAGFFIFNRGQGKEGESIKLSVTAPKKVASGEEIEVEISYLNQDNVLVKDADLTLLYPEGFYFSRSLPEAQNEAHTYWQLGKIESGAGGKIRIFGQIIGEIEVTKTFIASLQYTPANFSSVFEQKEAFSLEITSSILELTLDTPLRIVSDQETEIKIKFKNNSDLPLANLKIVVTYPDGFTLEESDPKSLEDGHTWLIEALKNNETKTISLKGVFRGNPGDTKEILVQLGLILENGEFRLQTEKSALIFIVKPELNLKLSVDGGNQTKVVNLGETLEFKVNYKNASDLELKNVVLKVEFTSQQEILDFSKIEDPQNGKIEDKTITWTSEEISEFTSLIPQAEGNFSFKIPTYSTIVPKKETDHNFSIEAVVKVVALEMEESLGNFEKMSESNKAIIKVNSKVSLRAEGRYYSEEFEQLGSGPLPPVVGQTTSYRIFWTVSNLYNEIENVDVSAMLPKDVFWTGRALAKNGSITFDTKTRKVIWKIEHLSANTGQLFPVAEANFEVSITPTSSDEGKLMVLASESTLTARDRFTNQDIEITDKLITTDFESDLAAQGRGVVAPVNINENLNTNLNENSDLPI